MSRTQLTGNQIGDGSVQRHDLDSTTSGQSVIKKLIAGSGVSIVSTGADSGTGDVTISVLQVTPLTPQPTTTTNNYSSISTVNAATRLIQTQGIMAQLVSMEQS